MKKYIILTAIFFMSYMSSSIANQINIIDNANNLFKVDKKFHLPISSGNWTQVRNNTWQGWGLSQKVYGIGKVNNNEIEEIVEVYVGNLAGKWDHWINRWINDEIFKNKYDGCYERPEYYLVEFYRKGITYNCLVIRHIDIFKLLQNPDSPHGKAASASYNYWLKNNPDVIVPATMLYSYHGYFSRPVSGKWYEIRHLINPKIIGAPKNNSNSEEGSEYHRNNISNFPKHKKSMEDWISISSKQHKIFEELVGSKSYHKLHLSKYITSYKINDDKNNNDLVKELQNLNNLFESGALSKEEFEKAKKKILD